MILIFWNKINFLTNVECEPVYDVYQKGDHKHEKKNPLVKKLKKWKDENGLRSKIKKVDKAAGPKQISYKQWISNSMKRIWHFRKKATQTEDRTDIENEYSKIFEIIRAQSNSFQIEMLAATVSSTISTLISTPFDEIRHRFQDMRYPKGRYYRLLRIRHVALDLIKSKGFRNMFKGHLPKQIYSLFQVSSMFYTYSVAHNFLEDIDKFRNNPILVSFMAGSFSAIVPAVVVFPLENARYNKMRFNRATGHYAAPFRRCGNQWPMLITRGHRSLLLHTGILYGLRFCFFTAISDHIKSEMGTHEKATSTNPRVSQVDAIDHLSNYQLIMAGGIAAMLGDIIAYPLEVINARLNMSALKRQQFKYEHTCRSFSQCIRMILRHERILAFYSGLLSSMLVSAVDMGVQFAVYEKTKLFLMPLFPT